MAADEKWYFTKEQLKNTPSRRCGIDADKELSYRQQAANFIQDMGQRLVVSQLCINTAIVYMHRFYVFHSLQQFHRNAIAAAALFLAAKVEEQPRKLEHVIKMAHMCLHRDQPPPDTRSEQYLEQAQDLVFNENVLLQTLGFDVAIDHPHTHVVRCCQLVKASKDLAQTSYFMASNSLHLTTMCLQYKPTVVACFCIHLACKWSSWEIPQSSEGKHWFWYVDKTVTAELLQQLTAEFLHIFDKCPSRLKRKILSISANQSPNMSHPSLPNSPFDTEPRKIQSPANVNEGGPIFHSNRQNHNEKQQDEKKNVATISTRPPVDYREYREKKEREKLEREKVAAAAAAAAAASSSSSSSSSTTAQNHSTDVVKHHSHHHKTISAGNAVTKHPLQSGQKAIHHNHHHRPEMKGAQSVQQRHSSGSSQQRDPNRDPARQRLPRDYNSTGTAIHSSSHGHQATAHPPKEANLETAQSVDPVHRTESVGSSQESQEKPSGSHRFGSVDNKLASSTHEKQQRGYDPRHKPPEHRKEADQRSYSKYPELSRVDRQRKPPVESLEQQRCEEVRKLLIDKPHQPPKSTLELPAYSQKQQSSSHHNKYPQSDKHVTPSSGITDPKMNVFVPDKSPSTSQKQQQLPPQQVPSKPILSTPSIQLIPQILKDTIKNGSSQSSALSLNNLDDPKAEKRPRHETDSAHETSQNSVHATPPPSRHKSLFSPEKSTSSSSSSSHSQRSKSKQKTPPSAVKAPKQERIPPVDASLVSPFASPPPPPVHQEVKRVSDSSTAHKKHKPINPSDLPEVKVKVEDIALGGSLEAMKMLGRIPELIQPIRDNPLASNGRGTSVANDLKPPELIKPFEPEPILGFSQQSSDMSNLTNGVVIKSESEDTAIKVEDQSIKKENDNNVMIQRPETPIKMDHPAVKVERLSPMKSAQSISALLQEPLAPIIPSLLQQSTSTTSVVLENTTQPPQQDESKLLSQQQLLAPEYSAPTEISNESTVVSTVDMSILSVPSLNSSTVESTVPPVPVSSTTIVPPIVVTAAPEEKRSEHHHKSEKKKKKDKHKRKDKDKSKEKHKHKHKDKDKDKHHRDKEKDNTSKPPEESIPTIPIKITIPKDKLNLSTDSATAALRCKIKLSKERHKGTTEGNLSLSSTTAAVISTTSSAAPIVSASTVPAHVNVNASATATVVTATPIAVSTSSIPSATAATIVQAPLKIKIRTDSISRSGLLPSTNPDHHHHHHHHQVVSEGRKRPSSDVQDTSGMPANKKQATQQSQPQHRSGERQNGRHYSGSNNKVRGAGRGGGGGGGGGGRQFSTGRGCPPPPSGTTYATGQQQQQQLQRDGYNYRQDYSGNSLRSCSSHPPPRLSHPPDGGGGGSNNSGSTMSSSSSSSNNTNNNNNTSMSFRRSTGAPAPTTTRNNTSSMPSDSAFFFTSFPPPNIYPAGYIYDPAAAAAYYQQYQQQFAGAAAAYSAATNLMIDTSVPPPSIRQPTIRKPNSPPPLPSGPPPGSSPPPPPPPPE